MNRRARARTAEFRRVRLHRRCTPPSIAGRHVALAYAYAAIMPTVLSVLPGYERWERRQHPQ